MTNNYYYYQYEINDQLKDQVKLAVDRSTHASKLRDFREWMDAVKKDTLHRVSVHAIAKFNPVCLSMMGCNKI